MSIKRKLIALKPWGFGFETLDDERGYACTVWFEQTNDDGSHVSLTSPQRVGKTEDGALRKCISAWDFVTATFPRLPIPLEAQLALLEIEIDALVNEITWLSLETRNAT